MPAYATLQSGGKTSLSPGDMMFLLNSESLNGASRSFSRGDSNSQTDQGVTFQAFGTSGSIQVQGSYTDVDATYVNIGSAITIVAAPGTASYVTILDRFRWFRVIAATVVGATVIAQR